MRKTTQTIIGLTLLILLACGNSYETDQSNHLYGRVIEWQQREPETVERSNGIRPTLAELKAFCNSFETKWVEIDLDKWPTSKEVENDGLRSNCVGLSHYTFQAIRNHFNISDSDLLIAIYEVRPDELHTVLSIETSDGHYWYDRSFGDCGIWYQIEKTILMKYNLFDVW